MKKYKIKLEIFPQTITIESCFENEDDVRKEICSKGFNDLDYIITSIKDK